MENTSRGRKERGKKKYCYSRYNRYNDDNSVFPNRYSHPTPDAPGHTSPPFLLQSPHMVAAQVFFFAAALALAAFFLLLLIITIPINVPTTAEARRVRKTGMRIAQTRGGKRSWSGWPGSTNGWDES